MICDTGSSSGSAVCSDQTCSVTSASAEHGLPSQRNAKDTEVTGSLLIISSFSCDLWASTVLTTTARITTQPNPAGTQAVFGLWASPHSPYMYTMMSHNLMFFREPVKGETS